MYHTGLDIGSTTIKSIVLKLGGAMFFSHYERHNALISDSNNKKTPCFDLSFLQRN